MSPLLGWDYPQTFFNYFILPRKGNDDSVILLLELRWHLRVFERVGKKMIAAPVFSQIMCVFEQVDCDKVCAPPSLPAFPPRPREKKNLHCMTLFAMWPYSIQHKWEVWAHETFFFSFIFFVCDWFFYYYYYFKAAGCFLDRCCRWMDELWWWGVTGERESWCGAGFVRECVLCGWLGQEDGTSQKYQWLLQCCF